MAWLARWGFAMLVALGTALAIWVASTVEIPDELPNYALQAAPVYRLEVGAAVFTVTYVASLAFVLALGNRGFSELSATGVKARDLRGETLDETIEEHDEILDTLSGSIAELRERGASLERRIEE